MAGSSADARAFLAGYFETTPLVLSDSLSTPGRLVFLKDETVLPTGSFKVRGALYALSMTLARRAIREVVAASTGNHGAAVAYAGAQLGVAVRIFLPTGANAVKAARIRDLGATLVEAGNDLSDAIDGAAGYAAREDAFFLHDASNADIPCGTATIGAEICAQCPRVDHVYVPMGDTALIRGVASAIRLTDRPVRIIGVVAAAAPAYALSWKAGAVVETSTADTIADGLAIRRPLAPNVEAIRALVDTVVLVSEQEMLEAIVWLRDRDDLLAEPAAAASIAALRKDEARPGTSVALVTGRNLAPEVARILG